MIAIGALLMSCLAPPLERIARVEIPGAEIVTYDAGTNCAFVTSGATIRVLHLGHGDDPIAIRSIDVGDALGRSGEISHVTRDPAGRGVVAACFIPAANATETGFAVFVSTRSGRVLSAVPVGYNPDACAFSASGDRLVVANEGEPAFEDGVLQDPPGSVSLVRLDGVATEDDFAKLGAADVATIYPGGLDLSGVRVHPWNRACAVLDLEPESLVIDGRVAYVACQENDAVAVVSLDAARFVAIHSLGAIEQTVDARADGRIDVSQRVAGLPQPDQIQFLRVGSGAAAIPVVVAANEGDDRGIAGKDGPVADRVRRQDGLAVSSYPGDAEHAPMLGTRSVSLWDPATFERLGDTGSAFEEWTARRMPEWFNADVKDGTPVVDQRSDDRGPEPEGLQVATIGGRAIVFCTLERPGAIATIDVTNPRKPTVLDVLPTAPDGDVGPEGMQFVSAEESPAGEALLIAAYEVSGSVSVYRVRIE